MRKASPLADAAARLDRLAADLKQRQFEATGVKETPRPAESPAGGHPEAVWRQAYAVRAIRPGAGAPPENFPPRRPSPSQRPELAAPTPEKRSEPAGEADPIGAVLGKPARRRGWWRRDH